jgi:glycosyltransferase involved in cell wall biosynthesis
MSCVEIFISDNNSIDDTQRIVSECQRKFGNIHYFKNDKNVGFDLNVVNSIEKSRGKYCMYLGDDDAIAIGGIRFLVDYLKRTEISVLTYDMKDYAYLKDSRIHDGDIPDTLIHSTTSHDDFLRKGYSLGIFSYFTFDRKLWLANVDTKDFIEGWLYHDVIVKMSAMAEHPLVHISYPITYAKQDCLWVKGGGEISAFLNSKKLFEKWLTYDEYDTSIFTNILDAMPKRLIVILLRAKGHDLAVSSKNFKLLYAEFHTSRLYFSIATVIFFVPNWIIKLARDFNKKITKIKI